MPGATPNHRASIGAVPKATDEPGLAAPGPAAEKTTATSSSAGETFPERGMGSGDG